MPCWIGRCRGGVRRQHTAGRRCSRRWRDLPRAAGRGGTARGRYETGKMVSACRSVAPPDAVSGASTTTGLRQADADLAGPPELAPASRPEGPGEMAQVTVSPPPGRGHRRRAEVAGVVERAGKGRLPSSPPCTTNITVPLASRSRQLRRAGNRARPIHALAEAHGGRRPPELNAVRIALTYRDALQPTARSRGGCRVRRPARSAPPRGLQMITCCRGMPMGMVPAG